MFEDFYIYFWGFTLIAIAYILDKMTDPGVIFKK